MKVSAFLADTAQQRERDPIFYPSFITKEHRERVLKKNSYILLF